jgi:hypothetical protein
LVGARRLVLGIRPQAPRIGRTALPTVREAAVDAMIGMGDYYESITASEERHRGPLCRDPDCEAEADEKSAYGLCASCNARLHPRCACGCGNEATLVADVYVDSLHDCRAPWLNVEHALGAVDSNHPVDVRPLDPLAEIIKAAPCWCKIRTTTVCDFCPEHGTDFLRIFP